MKMDIIGLDLAKNSLQVHGATFDGCVVLQRKISRQSVHAFFEKIEPCIVAMEACASAHYWGRELASLGHEVKLISPLYVKPFVKRQKNDAADAEAICEAALRPTMRFVAVKSEEKQSASMAFKVRDLLVRQKTQVTNAIRGHLTEFGIFAPVGPYHVETLVDLLEDEASTIPDLARAACLPLVAIYKTLKAQIRDLDTQIARRAKTDEVAHRLMSIPGVGPITATAIEAFAPPAVTFAKGRDFSAWIGLTPRQFSTGGKTKLGKTSKMGRNDLRQLFIRGAASALRRARCTGPRPGSWLARMLDRKHPMLITVALANRMARIAWALMTKGGTYDVNLAA